MTAEHHDSERPLIAHLLELRTRLLRGVAGLGVVLACLLPFANTLYGYLAQPLLAKLPKGGQLIATQVASPFFAPMKLAFFAALVVAMPWLLYQAWAFVAPGLYRRERRLALPLLSSALLLFYAGCAFAYFLVLPMVFGFMARVTPDGVAMMTDISAYLDFVLVMFLAFGLSFELPVALVILVAAGLGHPGAAARRPRLRGGRHLHRRRGADPAGRGHPADAGDPDVPAVRGRHRRRAPGRAARAPAGVGTRPAPTRAHASKPCTCIGTGGGTPVSPKVSRQAR